MAYDSHLSQAQIWPLYMVNQYIYINSLATVKLTYIFAEFCHMHVPKAELIGTVGYSQSRW